MAIEHQFVDQMAANEASPTSHENAFPVLISPELDLWITACLGKMTQLQICVTIPRLAMIFHLWHP